MPLPETISRLRKQHHVTQEQLSEALGVSFAAVSKWERGVATPDLPRLMALADFFGVSLDTLTGYELRHNQKDALLTELQRYVHDRTATQALSEAEKALRRYPNCFAIVYYSAVNYQVRSLWQNEPAYARRALTLYGHACRLLEQNTDESISETSLYQAMALLHIRLGSYETGLHLLKTHNPCRLHHALIGQTLASSCNDPKGAEPYLSMALLDSCVTHMQLVMGYVNVYLKTNNAPMALQVLSWALPFYQGLKKPGSVSCLDKEEAALWAIRAYVYKTLGDETQAKTCLMSAYQLAKRFDEAPCYDSACLLFVAKGTAASPVDDLGDTALKGLTTLIDSFEDALFSSLWEALCHEEK